MAADLSLALLTSVVTMINADAPLAVLVGTRIYDTVPDNPAYPFISLPAHDSETNRFKGGIGQTHSFDFDVWSRYPGQSELRNIGSALFDIFETITPPGATGNHSGLTVTGGTISLVQIDTMRVIQESDRRTLHGMISLTIRTRST